jgi:hypothetical protein
MMVMMIFVNALEQQARAYARGEVCDRLEMTHTCSSILSPCKHISEERLEIQWEEEELEDQLERYMEEFDLRRAEFDGGPMEFVEYFFDSQDMDITSSV